MSAYKPMDDLVREAAAEKAAMDRRIVEFAERIRLEAINETRVLVREGLERLARAPEARRTRRGQIRLLHTEDSYGSGLYGPYSKEAASVVAGELRRSGNYTVVSKIDAWAAHRALPHSQPGHRGQKDVVKVGTNKRHVLELSW
ncbi:MAG TPA: hypothetical protein VE953_15335 [Terriglobales bacterium]|nr:hypothetical protein [Terriglobales bacterium]